MKEKKKRERENEGTPITRYPSRFSLSSQMERKWTKNSDTRNIEYKNVNKRERNR